MEERADGETRLVCVWGSPLSGKTTFVQNHAGRSDIIWDWDKIQQAVSLSDSYQEASPQTLRLLLRLRKTFIKAASDCGAKTAWLICCRPNKYVRDLLGDKAEYIKMDVSKDECYRRLAADNSRPDKQKMAALIEDFFSKEPYEERGWITKNGSHIYIGEDGGTGASAKGVNIFVRGFKNKQALNNHWQNGRTHQEEYAEDGITTKEQYEARALELAQSACSDTILGYKNALGEIVRYDTDKNDFVKGNPNRNIKTLFKPSEKMAYFERMRKLEAVEDE